MPKKEPLKPNDITDAIVYMLEVIRVNEYERIAIERNLRKHIEPKINQIVNQAVAKTVADNYTSTVIPLNKIAGELTGIAKALLWHDVPKEQKEKVRAELKQILNQLNQLHEQN